MALRNKSHFWRKSRIIFRRFRITVWLLILSLLLCVLYLNQIGLPNFAKRRLQETLRARGLDLEFTRLRWRWASGLVAEDVRFGRADEASIAKFSVKEAEVQFDYRALARFQIQVNALVLHAGELTWQLGTTNVPTHKLSLEKIQAELRLLPGDLWELDHFQAQFAGARFQFGGMITNASVMRDWKVLHPSSSTTPGSLERRLRQLSETLEHIRFASPPEFHLEVQGDARDLQSFTVRLKVNAPGADTPWGTVQQGLLTIMLLPSSSNELSHAKIDLEAASAQTRWAGATNLSLKLNLISGLPNTNVVQADLKLSAASINTRWSQAADAHFTAQWQHSITNAFPLSGHGELQVDNPRTRWANAGQLHFVGNFEPATNAALYVNDSWAWWTNLAPFALNWDCEVYGLESPKLNAREVACSGVWRAPELTLTHLSSVLYGGHFNAEAGLNVATRQLAFKAGSDFDPQFIAAFLPEKNRHWFTELALEQRPKLQASGSVPLPAWTNLMHADWSGEVRPALRLDGYFELDHGSLHGMPFSSADSHFSYSNLLWRVPDFVLRRPEGQLRVTHLTSEATRDFYFKIYSTLDPVALKPLLQTNQYRVYDIVKFNQAPLVDGELWGRWREPDRLGARAYLAVTNFSIHDQAMGDAVANLEYTNRFLKIIEPRAHRGTIEHGSATGLGLDFRTRTITITNAVGVADALAIARAVGPNIGRHIEPYHFLQPVSARVEGIIPMHDPQDADLHFDLEGGPFTWWKFNSAHVKGHLDWVGETLGLRDIQAAFYGGTVAGNADFYFHEHEHGTDFRVSFVATDADLHLLVNDLSPKTNHLEGLLTARLAIREGNTADLHTIQGEGRANLRDGLIWDIPLFGVLSPALEGMAPGIGLGSSRAREGTASFVITNGVARTDDLEIRASLMRLQYSGTVDLVTKKLDALAQAELFRDTWMVGRLLSLTLWPVSKVFEYRFSGTLHQPKSEPLFFVPKILMMPLHPFRTLKELSPELPEAPATNAPPAPAQP